MAEVAAPEHLAQSLEAKAEVEKPLEDGAVGKQNPEQQQGAEDDEAAAFQCNICYEVAKEPVVTLCGHLYCWPCVYRFVTH